MIAVDTQLLVYAHREEAPDHVEVGKLLFNLSTSPEPWAIAWPCVHEFLATVTRPKYFDPPSTMPDALEAMEAWMASPSLRLLSEGADHFEWLGRLLLNSGVRGPRVHDARIAAICLSHGVEALWTRDRDFSYFSPLRAIDPLTE